MGKHGQTPHHVARLSAQTYIIQITASHAGKQGYGNELRGSRWDSLTRRGQHFSPTQRMNVHHPHPQSRRDPARICHGAGDIMKFQIEEDVKTLTDYFFHKPWSGSGKKLLSHLDPARTWIKSRSEERRVGKEWRSRWFA